MISPALNFIYGSQNKRLEIKHISEETFAYAAEFGHDYGAVETSAAVVPHHLTASQMIGGFFRALAAGENSYDAVILVGPNHTGEVGEIVVSYADWNIRDGVRCDRGLVGEIAKSFPDPKKIKADDSLMEGDHSLSVLIPFVEYYFPGAAVAPILIGRSLSYDETVKLSDSINKIISGTEKNILLLCSIDFSHFLTPSEARLKDAETLDAIKKAGYRSIHAFSNANVDSPASLIIFLRYLGFTGMKPLVVDNADASRYMGPRINETTSYFLLAGTF